MALLESQPTGPSGGNTQERTDAFNGASLVETPLKPIPDIREDIADLGFDFNRKREGMNATELRAFHAGLGDNITALKEMQVLAEESLSHFNLVQTEEWLLALSDAASFVNDMPSSFGADFVEARKQLGVSRIINTSISGQGSYSAYQIGGPGKARINQVSLSTMSKGTDNDLTFYGADPHENIHAASLVHSKVMKRTPWNLESKALVHPLAWARAELIAENLGYGGNGLLYGLLSLARPDLRSKIAKETAKHAVSLDDFDQKFSSTYNFQGLCTEICLDALKKRTKRGNNTGPTDGDRAYDNALLSYADGLAARIKAGHTDFEYVDLEPEDYYSIGNLGVGVNFLGKDSIDSRFMDFPKMRQDQQEYLDDLCQRYNIPLLSSCRTLREYESENSEPQEKATPAQGVASHSSGGMVHTPSYN